MDENKLSGLENEAPKTVEKETNAVPPVYTSGWLKANTKMQGWLSFFMVVVILGGLVSAVYPIATFNLDDYAGNVSLAVGDILTGLNLLAVAIYVVWGFVNRKPNAVFWGLTYVALAFLTNLLTLVLGGTEGGGLQSTSKVIQSMLWGVVWFFYLICSEQVKRVIPESFRKVSKIDWGALAAIVLVPTLLLAVGYAQISAIADERIEQEESLRDVALAGNERTDGKVIFAVPDGFECESQDVEVEGNTACVFNLSNDDVGSCTMCSDYDSDKSESNFDEYWENWKDEDAKVYRAVDVDRGTMNVNGNDCLYRITKYDVNGTHVYWRFCMLFDEETGKVLVASFYDRNEDTGYVDDLLNSVRFK